MTENKRFTITGDRSISDHQKKRLYDLNDFDGMISVTECLNKLHEDVERQREFKFSAIRQANRIDKENEQLKKENKELKEKNKLSFEQIRAFGKSHHADMDFEGSRVANQLLYYLKDLENGD